MNNTNTKEIAERLKGLREMMEISAAEMAEVAGVDEKTYLEYEKGAKDFSVTFLYNCAGRFGVDVTALLTGYTPTLSSYSIVRAGQGVLTERRHMFTYQHLAQNFAAGMLRGKSEIEAAALELADAAQIPVGATPLSQIEDAMKLDASAMRLGGLASAKTYNVYLDGVRISNDSRLEGAFAAFMDELVRAENMG